MTNITENQKLSRKYPFLKQSMWPWYNAESTWLDAMPNGWRVAFGEQMCDEIREALIAARRLRRYRVLDIKEKFGQLRWLDNGASDAVEGIVRKYEKLSAVTCIRCGHPATQIAQGCVLPFCDDCVPETHGRKWATTPIITNAEETNEKEKA